jgi:hypothetical protein
MLRAPPARHGAAVSLLRARHARTRRYDARDSCSHSQSRIAPTRRASTRTTACRSCVRAGLTAARPAPTARSRRCTTRKRALSPRRWRSSRSARRWTRSTCAARSHGAAPSSPRTRSTSSSSPPSSVRSQHAIAQPCALHLVLMLMAVSLIMRLRDADPLGVVTGGDASCLLYCHGCRVDLLLMLLSASLADRRSSQHKGCLHTAERRVLAEIIPFVLEHGNACAGMCCVAAWPRAHAVRWPCCDAEGAA